MKARSAFGPGPLCLPWRFEHDAQLQAALFRDLGELLKEGAVARHDFFVLAEVLVVEFHALHAELLCHLRHRLRLFFDSLVRREEAAQKFPVLFHMLFPYDVIREAQIPLDLANAVGVYERLHLLRHIKLVLLVVASGEDDDLRELAAHRAIVGIAGRRIPANVPGRKFHRRVRRTLQRLRLCASPEGKPCGEKQSQHPPTHKNSPSYTT